MVSGIRIRRIIEPSSAYLYGTLENLLIIYRISRWSSKTSLCSNSRSATSQMRRLAPKHLQLSFSQNESAITSSPPSARSTCRPTVSTPTSLIRDLFSCRQRHHLLPQGRPGPEEGVPRQRAGEEHPRAAVQEPHPREGDGLRRRQAPGWALPPGPAGPAEGAEAVDHERVRRRHRRRLPRVGLPADRGAQRPDGREEGDHDLHGPDDGRQVLRQHPRQP